MLLLIDVIGRKDLKENMQMEVLYSLAKSNLKTDVDYLRIDVDAEMPFEKNGNDKFLYVCIQFEPDSARFSYQIVRYLKERNPICIIFAVGVFATYSFERIFADCECIDHIILGEYEEPIIGIVNDFLSPNNEKRSCYQYCDLEKNLWKIEFEKNCPKRLNEFDMKKYPSFLERRYIWEKTGMRLPVASIEAARGCIGRCAFCRMNYAYNTSYITWRCRPMPDVYEEMVHIFLQYGICVFLICDSALEVPAKFGKERLNELCELLLNSEYKFSIRCCMRATSFSDNDSALISKMSKAGFVEVLLGIESANASDQELYCKPVPIVQANSVINIFRKSGIILDIGFINFNPYSTNESLRENYSFLKKNEYFYDYYFLTKLGVEYNTPIYKRLLKENMLGSEYSYINVYQYEYNNEEAKYAENRLKMVLDNVSYKKYERRYIEFSVLFYAVMRIYNEEVYGKFQSDVYPFVKKISTAKFEMIAEILFSELNVHKVIDKYDSYLANVYTELNRIVFAYARNREYIKYMGKRNYGKHEKYEIV